MTTQQDKLINRLKWTAFISSLTALLLVISLGLVQSGITVPLPSKVDDVQNLIPNPYKPEDYTYQNGYLACTKGQTILGIDVSYYQGQIRWQEVADSGMAFAMIRLGYRTIRDGSIRTDVCWEENYQGATQAGMQVGVYFYSTAISVEEARQEAQYVLDELHGRNLDMPVVFDWENYGDGARNLNVDKQTLTDCVIAFCDTIAQAGYRPMVYFNDDYADRLMDMEQFQSRGYGFWMAMYQRMLNWRGRVDMWQYTCTGIVPGIDVNVDINLLFVYE